MVRLAFRRPTGGGSRFSAIPVNVCATTSLLGVDCCGSKLSSLPGRAGSLKLLATQWAADRLNGQHGAVRSPPYARDACHYACPATTGRKGSVRCRWCRCERQAWSMRATVSHLPLGLCSFLEGRHGLFSRRFSLEKGRGAAGSRCVTNYSPVSKRWSLYVASSKLGQGLLALGPLGAP